VNDGKSLDMVPDGSVDFVFSFDSLVHAEEDVIEAYLGQLARKLTPNGTGFMHHSNIGKFQAHFRFSGKLTNRILKRVLIKFGAFEPNDYLRAYSMTAEKFRQIAETSGLRCNSQEIINWNDSRRLIDCLSVFSAVRSNERFHTRILRNKDFVKQTMFVRRLSKLYGERCRLAIRDHYLA
jgi:hypothetical protein